MIALAIFAFCCLPFLINGSVDIPYNNPALGTYQNEEACFPLHETWYVMYRNYEQDPYFGGTGKCIKLSETGSFKHDSAPLQVDIGDDVHLDVKVTLMSSPGYTVKNVLHADTTKGPKISFNLTAIYADCNRCKVLRHDYVDEGCSFWLPESALGQDVQCCSFIYDLVCGPKYPLCEEI